ncbi:MAG: hypothetical protein J5928_01085 [Firmicutes bacterium]|nr:hypothetical protein [Bacillota bacterium]
MNNEHDKKAIEKRIANLPKGYISKKRINGKERFYLQWREGNKIKSKYIKTDELEAYKKALEERKELEQMIYGLREGESAGMVAESEVGFEYNVYARRYLKWEDDVIGVINGNREVSFTKPDYNPVVSAYTKGKSHWTRTELQEFLAERIVSRDRRDIEKILFKLGLSSYDIFEIAEKTKAINAKDMLWLAEKESDRMADAVSDVFDSVFRMKKDLEGDSVDTPEGYNIKRYGVYRGKYGIYKERIHPLSTDIESEIAVYKLAKLMKVPCCRCYKVNEKQMFSVFEYDFINEHIVHFRRLVSERGENELNNLISARPNYIADFARMIALDFVTRQDDRHLSNIAVKIDDSGLESFYPLYDNGRSLFYEDTEETVKKACKNIEEYATTFGPAGTYWDYIKELSEMGISFSKLVNLDIGRDEIKELLVTSGFTGYKLSGGTEWIKRALDLLKKCK